MLIWKTNYQMGNQQHKVSNFTDDLLVFLSNTDVTILNLKANTPSNFHISYKKSEH